MGIICLEGKDFTFLLSFGNYLTPQCALVSRKMKELWEKQLEKDFWTLKKKQMFSFFKITQVNPERITESIKALWKESIFTLNFTEENIDISRAQILFHFLDGRQPIYHLHHLFRIQEALELRNQYYFWRKVIGLPVFSKQERIAQEYRVDRRYVTEDQMRQFHFFMKDFAEKNPEIIARILSLNFTFSKLFKIPEPIILFFSVESLHFNNNQIEVIPSEINHLPNLQKLDLSHNPIREVSSLPLEFFQRVKVTLSLCCKSEIPEEYQSLITWDYL